MAAARSPPMLGPHLDKTPGTVDGPGLTTTSLRSPASRLCGRGSAAPRSIQLPSPAVSVRRKVGVPPLVALPPQGICSLFACERTDSCAYTHVGGR